MVNKINLRLRPSRYFFTLISGVHMIMLFFACISEIRWLFFIIVLATVLLSYYYLVNKYVFRNNKYSIVELAQDPDSLDPNQWFLVCADNKKVAATLKPKGYVSIFLITLHFKVLRVNKIAIFLSSYNLLKKMRFKTVSVVIFPDMIDYSDYHKLTKYLTGY